MSFGRTRRWSVTALLAGAVLALGTLVAPAEAVTARTISFRASTSSALAGQPITVAGTVSKAPKGSYVYIQKYNGRYWLITALATTSDTAGSYRYQLTMPNEAGTSAYRAYVPQVGNLGAATSRTIRLTSLRKVSTSLKAASSTVSLGKPAKLIGKVSPFLAGTTVTLERYSGLAWSKLTTKKLSSTGTFAYGFYPKATLSYRFKVPRTGIRAAATSGAVKITVTGGAAAPTITTSSLPGATVGATYFQTLTKTGGSGTWSLLSGKLPAGLALKSASGVITGTPTKVGTSGFKVAFTSSAGPATAKSLSITVLNGPVITTTSLPSGSRGTAYSTTLTKTGEDGTWAVTGGALPAGVTLNADSGAVSGTPTVDGTFPVTFTFTETVSTLAATKSLQLVIADPPDPVITTTTLPDGVKDNPYGPVTLQKTGNAGTWALEEGTLPAGVTLSPAGVLSGTPTATGDFFPTVRFTEANGTTDSQVLLLHVSAEGAPVITATLPTGQVGAPYTGDLNATPGTIGNPWSITFGSLPPGLSLNANTGAITGTPTTAGDFYFIVKYQVFLGANNTKFLSIHVDPA